MNVQKFTGPGSTPSRRLFWDNAADSIESLTKQQGKNVSVQEFPGQGTIINVDRKAGTPTPPPTCPSGDDVPTITLTFSGVTACLNCLDYLGSPSIFSINNVNNAFTLTWVSMDFQWEGTASNAYSIQQYSDEGCITPLGDPFLQDVSLVVSCEGGSGTWVVSAGFFNGSGTDRTDIANTLTCGGSSRFTGGTAAITF